MSDKKELDQPFAPRKHKQEEAELDITPMIDITFLLLSFFVVCSKMDPSAAVKVPAARFADTVSEKNCVCLIMLPDENSPESCRIFRGRSTDEKDRFTETDPLEVEEAVQSYVLAELGLRPTVEGVLIKAAGKVRTGQVEMVKRGISMALGLDPATGEPRDADSESPIKLLVGVEKQD